MRISGPLSRAAPTRRDGLLERAALTRWSAVRCATAGRATAGRPAPGPGVPEHLRTARQEGLTEFGVLQVEAARPPGAGLLLPAVRHLEAFGLQALGKRRETGSALATRGGRRGLLGRRRGAAPRRHRGEGGDRQDACEPGGHQAAGWTGAISSAGTSWPSRM